MTTYTIPHPFSLSQEVAVRRAARRKVIEKARKLERDSYKVMMDKRRRLQARTHLATIG